MSYLWPIKDRRESRIIYICQGLGALVGVFVFTALNRWRVDYWPVLLGVFAGWFIGAFIYIRFAAKETDTEIAVPPNATAETEKDFDGSGDVNETGNRFVMQSSNDIEGQEEYVDVDDPCLNHFRYHRRVEIWYGKSEFEYRVEGTRVFVRLLQDFGVEPGEGEKWNVRDGVVMESDMRSRDTNVPFDLDEEIADLKKQTEWCELLLMGVDTDRTDGCRVAGSHLVGLKYFILSKRMPPVDARRLIRQEIERLKMGAGVFTKEAAKHGLEPVGRYGLRPVDGRSCPSSDEVTKLVESISTFGISYREFRSREGIVAALEKLLTGVKG